MYRNVSQRIDARPLSRLRAGEGPFLRALPLGGARPATRLADPRGHRHGRRAHDHAQFSGAVPRATKRSRSHLRVRPFFVRVLCSGGREDHALPSAALCKSFSADSARESGHVPVLGENLLVNRRMSHLFCPFCSRIRPCPSFFVFKNWDMGGFANACA